MRADEEFAKNCIVKFLDNEFSEIEVLNGDEPPDYFLVCNGKKYSLEVTQCKSLLTDNGKLVDRETSTKALDNYINNISELYKNLLPENYCLLFTICIPIIYFKRFKRDLKKFISNDLSKIDKSVTRGKIEIANEIIGWHLFPECGKKPISVLIDAKPYFHEYCIEKHAANMIGKAIKTKTEIMQKVSINNIEGHWLALFCDYPLADMKNYLYAINEININHCFDRIFIVLLDSQVSYRKFTKNK